MSVVWDEYVHQVSYTGELKPGCVFLDQHRPSEPRALSFRIMDNNRRAIGPLDYKVSEVSLDYCSSYVSMLAVKVFTIPDAMKMSTQD